MAADDLDRKALEAIRTAQRLRGEQQAQRQRALAIADNTRTLILEVGMLKEHTRKLRRRQSAPDA